MSNIKSQRIDSNGLEIVISDGRTFSVTRVRIRANFLSQTGSVATRRSKTIQWLKNRLVASLGPEQINISRIALNFNETDGIPTQLEILSEVE